MDLFFYGFLIGGLAISNVSSIHNVRECVRWAQSLTLTRSLQFAIVVYGSSVVGARGDLGNNCNEGYSDSCENVYRGRATTTATLICVLMFHAWGA